MLVRKPREGEILTDGNNDYEWIETYYRHPEIGTIRNLTTGENTIFIWKFKEGLNSLFSIKEATI